jgi:phosphohistidine phosphatase
MAQTPRAGHVAAMKRLILLRHAKAERQAPSGEDFDRPLSPEGRRDAAAAGEALARAGLIPDLALVSAATRTRETFQAAAASLPDVRLEPRRDLYDAPAAALRHAAGEADGETVLVVAHNPGVGALARELAEACTAIGVEDRAFLLSGFPTATAAAFELGEGRIACLGVFRPDGASA